MQWRPICRGIVAENVRAQYSAAHSDYEAMLSSGCPSGDAADRQSANVGDREMCALAVRGRASAGELLGDHSEALRLYHPVSHCVLRETEEVGDAINVGSILHHIGNCHSRLRPCFASAIQGWGSRRSTPSGSSSRPRRSRSRSPATVAALGSGSPCRASLCTSLAARYGSRAPRARRHETKLRLALLPCFHQTSLHANDGGLVEPERPELDEAA